MFFDFRKAFLIYIFLKIFLNTNINLVNMPGVPLLTLELFCNISFTAYFFISKKELLYTKCIFPLKNAFIIVISSILLSTVFSTVGFSTAITRAIQEIVNSYVLVYVLWYVIRDISDIRFLLKGMVFVFLFLGIYGFYERFTGLNPIMEYERSINALGANVIDWTYGDSRLGLGRVQSVILHPIGYGLYLAVFMSFILYIATKYKKVLNLPWYSIVSVVLLCFVNLFFTNSRSPLIYFTIAIVPVFSLKNRYALPMMGIILLAIPLCFSFIQPYIENVISLLDPTHKSEAVGGSSGEMRIGQFVAAFKLMIQSPLIGLGIKSADSLTGGETGLLGLESVWLRLMIERGILGLFSHVFLIFSIFNLGKGTIKHFVWFSVFAWLILTSITSIPGCNISFFFMIIIILLKIVIFRKQWVLDIATSFNLSK